MDKGDPNSAILHMNTAIKYRPTDWWLLSQRAVYQLESGNSKQGNDDFDLAAKGVNGQQRDRVQVRMLIDSLTRQLKGLGLPRCSTLVALTTRMRADDPDLGRWRKYLSNPGVTCKGGAGD